MVAAALDSPRMRPKKAGVAQGLTLAIAGFLPILSILSLAPAVPTLIAHFRDVPNAGIIVPLLVTTPGLMVALLSPWAGWITDRYGRRKPLLIATAIYAFAGAAPVLFGGLGTVLLSRVAVGATETFVLVIVNALFADYYHDAARRTWITAQGFLGPALGAASITLAGWLASIQWNAVFLVYLLAFPVFIALYAWCFEPERQAIDPAGLRTTPTSAKFPWGVAAVFSSVTVFASTIYYVFSVQGGRAFEAIGVSSAAQIGVIMGTTSLGVILGSALFNLLSRRWASEQIIAVFLVILGIGTAGIGAARSVEAMTAFAFVQQIGAGMTVTALIFWVSRLLPAEHRGKGFGLWTSSFFVAQFISPAIVATIAGVTGGILSSFVILGAVSILAAIVILILAARMPKPLEMPNSPR